MTDGRKQIHTKRWNRRAAGDRSKRNQIKKIKKVRQMMEKFIVWRTFFRKFPGGSCKLKRALIGET